MIKLKKLKATKNIIEFRIRLTVISYGLSIQRDPDLYNYFDELEKSGMSLMIYRDSELIFQSMSKGIRPHLEAIKKHDNDLIGTVMVDKIVGRAAALLILYSKPKIFFKFIRDSNNFVVV